MLHDTRTFPIESELVLQAMPLLNNRRKRKILVPLDAAPDEELNHDP
jgi:hypothetical protein